MPQVPPDFLLRLVALTNFMRLSSLKAAHMAVGWCSVQEIRVAPGVPGPMMIFFQCFQPIAPVSLRAKDVFALPA